MKTLYVTVGMIGAGKTTYIGENLPDAFHLESDGYRMMLNQGVYKYIPKIEKYIFDSMYRLAIELLKEGDVVIDSISHTIGNRRKLLEFFRGRCKNQIVAIVFLVDPEGIERRVKEPRGYTEEEWRRIYTKHLSEYTFPEMEEGFDKIIIVE